MIFIAHATENTQEFVEKLTTSNGATSTLTIKETVDEVEVINMSDYRGTYLNVIYDLLKAGGELDVAFHDEHVTNIQIYAGEGDSPFVLERVVTSSNNVMVTGYNASTEEVFFGYMGTRGKMREFNRLPIAETFPFETWKYYKTTGPVVLEGDRGEYIRNGIKGIVLSRHLEDLVDNGGNVYEWHNYTLDTKYTMFPWETEGSYMIRSKVFNRQAYERYLRDAMVASMTGNDDLSFSQQDVLLNWLEEPGRKESLDGIKEKIRPIIEFLCETII